MTLLSGWAPVAKMVDYWQQVTAYTRGRGQLNCTLRGYEPCAEQEAVAAAIGYDPERDEENPTGSVFCQHGGGFYVPWDQVRQLMHVDSGFRLEGDREPAASPLPRLPCRPMHTTRPGKATVTARTNWLSHWLSFHSIALSFPSRVRTGRGSTKRSG